MNISWQIRLSLKKRRVLPLQLILLRCFLVCCSFDRTTCRGKHVGLLILFVLGVLFFNNFLILLFGFGVSLVIVAVAAVGQSVCDRVDFLHGSFFGGLQTVEGICIGLSGLISCRLSILTYRCVLRSRRVFCSIHYFIIELIY